MPMQTLVFASGSVGPQAGISASGLHSSHHRVAMKAAISLRALWVGQVALLLEVCKYPIGGKLRGIPIIVVQDAPQPLTAANDAFA